MKLNKRIVIVALALFAVAIGGFVAFHHKTDNRIFAYNPQTKERASQKQVIFLYAVDSKTGELKTYSPVLGEVAGNSIAISQRQIQVGGSHTQTGVPATVSIVKIDSTVDRSKEGDYLPALSWNDMQNKFQKQYFVNGVDLIFVADQPLKETDEQQLNPAVVSLLTVQR